METAVWAPPVRIAPIHHAPTRRRSSLPLESARQYGLLDEDWGVTELARDLASRSGQDLYDAFARHILLDCGGLRVVEGAQQMALDLTITGVQITGDTLAAYLTDQGFTVIVHNTAINSLRLWLARAGVFGPEDWKVNAEAKARLLGVSDYEISALINLKPEERAFAIALCRINPSGKYPASTVREMAETILGHRADRSSLPKLMEPLKSAGFIDFESGGTRSGKTARVWTTSRFKSDVLEPFLTNATKQLDSVLTEYYKRDLQQVYRDLDSQDTFVKGQALEAYAIQIMRRMELKFVRWRVRAKDQTGGAEVDAIMSGVLSSVPTRWQVQCKNTPRSLVRLEDVAREVGLLPLTKATHILILANCPFTKEATLFSQAIMRESSVTIFLLGKSEFEEIRQTNGGALARILKAKSIEASSLQRHGLDWLVE